MRDNRILNSVKKRDVLLANSPLPTRAKAEIDNLNLPQSYINQIKQYQVGIYPRELKEQELEALQAKKENIIGELVNTCLNDTNSENLDRLIQALKQDDDYKSKLVLIPLLISDGRYNKAQQQIQKLEQRLNELSPDVQTEVENFIELQNLNITLAQTPDSLKNSVIIANTAYLTALAADEDALGSVDAALLLQEAGVKKYYERIALPDENSAKLISPVGNSNANTMTDIQSGFINIYPNPVKDKLYIEILASEEVCDGVIELYSMEGKLIKQFELNEQDCVKTIDITNFATGEYMINVSCNGENIFTKKITIIK